jgi:excisionase family DNA binding protein
MRIEQLLTTDEAAHQLRVSRQRLYELVQEGLVPAVRLGRALRFSPSGLAEFVATGGKAWGGGWRKVERASL